MKSFSISAKLFIAIVIACGIGVLGYAAMHREAMVVARFAAFLGITVAAARLNVKLPGIDGSMSVNLPFILIALTQLSFLETVVIGCCSALIQCFWNGKKADAVKVLFNVCNMANSVGLAYVVYNFAGQGSSTFTKALLLAGAAAAYFLINTAPVAIIIGLVEKKSALLTWSNVFLWTYPYYLASAGVASMASGMSHIVGWQTPLLVLPVVYGVYCSYKKYFSSSQQEKLSDPQKLRASAAHN
jgi:hypothetical protein